MSVEFIAMTWWIYLGSVVQNSPIPTSLPEPLTASDIAAKKSQTKARYLKLYTVIQDKNINAVVPYVLLNSMWQVIVKQS